MVFEILPLMVRGCIVEAWRFDLFLYVVNGERDIPIGVDF